MNKFYMNGKLIHKASDHNTKRCEVEKWVFLPHSDFERLKANPYQEHEAITAARDLMYEDKNAYHCIMLLDEYKNDVKHLRRVERTHNSEGYFEDVMEDENGDKLLQIMDIDMEPIESVVDQRLESEEVIKAMDCLTDTQKERIKKYYFQQMTYEEIAKLEKVGKMTGYRSIRGGINKMKKNFFEKFEKWGYKMPLPVLYK